MPIPALPDRKAKKPLLAGMVGHQRVSKGALLLPELCKGLKEIGLLYAVHNSGPEEEFKEEWKDIIVDRTRYTPDNYREMISCLDILILPYLARAYKEMPSGIMCEAFASGTPVVVPADTQIAEILEFHNNGTTFDKFNVDSILRAVSKLVANYDEYKANALKAREEWASLNGPDKFLDAILNEANKDTDKEAVQGVQSAGGTQH
jgi:glycosyltransferase involved in cell wall biosynthesis